MQLLGILGFPGYVEIIVVLIVGLLVFGRRLPEVGRSVGRTIVEFKKGIREVKDDVDNVASRPSQPPPPLESPPTNESSPTQTDVAASSSPASNDQVKSEHS